MPVAHYENFPVASVLLPRRLRAAVEAIYWFARSADDLADEGDHPPAWRLAALDAYRARLDLVRSAPNTGPATARSDESSGRSGTAQVTALIPMPTNGRDPNDLNWERLYGAIARHQLPLQPFYDLLDAFSQDVVQSRYENFAQLADYCRRSANPVGRLMLHLFDAASAENLRDSDAICTSLQLLNFCQDVAVDWRKDRIYIPADEMAAAGVTGSQIAEGAVDARWQRLYIQQLDRALELLALGRPLAWRLRGRPGLELRAIVAGGERIGAKLAAIRGDVFRRRPVLTRVDWLAIAWRACGPAPASLHAAVSAPSS